ncbi:DUF922 domain-containing protein [Pseudoxanthomonas sp. PXM01]|uniref:DUF922 domain-containing protein n=1 Tax=Pseudoxanthomonas sp. PXM01 TaxID=2769295 RepID=UPI00177B3BE2|nr:DUF922 domain-containing protein [Pseudoxanthomonas sp. PXM01]MBD9469348.1 DUF922 domain-containing protein [Pseudoxanthomonas sp. PXM01]
MRRVCVMSGLLLMTTPALGLGDDPVAGELTVVYYLVSGSTARQIHRELEAKGPRDEEGRRYHGLAEWQVDWSYGLTQSGGDCVLTDVQVDLQGKITLPAWTPGVKASRGLVNEWARYIEALRRHEHGHYAHGMRAAEEIRALPGSLASSDCAAMGRSFNSKAMRILDKYRLMDRMYDERTEHGAREGALLQGN